MNSVAVIIPLYNKEATVARALNSVLAQTMRDFEIIIVDDGSTDKSIARVRQFADNRIRLIRQENAGPGAARNAGASQSEAPLLAFLDADDEWSPSFLQRAVDALRRHPDCNAFVAAYDTGPYQAQQANILYQLGLAQGPWKLDSRTPAKQIKKYIDACHSSCTVVRRKTFDALGGFYGVDRCTYGEDSYLWLQIVLNGKLFWCPELLVNYHVEDSALGLKLAGHHPIRPALTHPETLRHNCDTAAETLDRLLAHYRLLETEDLSHDGALLQIVRLRRQYPGSRFEKGLFWRERKIELRALLAKMKRPMRARVH